MAYRVKQKTRWWKLIGEILLIAAVCLTGMWQNTKKTMESISDVAKKEEKRIAITFDDGPDGPIPRSFWTDLRNGG